MKKVNWNLLRARLYQKPRAERRKELLTKRAERLKYGPIPEPVRRKSRAAVERDAHFGPFNFKK